jgi:hypothetical protein
MLHTCCDAHTQVGCIEASLYGLVECEAHGCLHVAVLGVQGGIGLKCLAREGPVLGRNREGLIGYREGLIGHREGIERV